MKNLMKPKAMAVKGIVKVREASPTALALSPRHRGRRSLARRVIESERCLESQTAKR